MTTAMAEALAVLRETFEARLLSEVLQFDGIPFLPVEEIALRDAIARVLAREAEETRPRREGR